MNSMSPESKRDITLSVNSLRSVFKTLVKAQSYEERVAALNEMLKHANRLNSQGRHCGHKELLNVTRPLISLLAEMVEKPQTLNSSNARSLAGTLDYFWEVVSGGETDTDFGDDKAWPVMVVDDEPLSLRATGFALQNGGFETVSVDSPKKALEAIGSRQWGLFLLDVDMPDINGYQLCRMIRENHSTADSPVIFVTGFNDSEVRTRMVDCLGNDVLTKPFSFPDLTLKCWTWFYRAKRMTAGGVSCATAAGRN